MLFVVHWGLRKIFVLFIVHWDPFALVFGRNTLGTWRNIYAFRRPLGT